MTQFYDRLLTETEAARKEFLAIEALQRGSRGAITLATYIAFLTQAYHHVKHTVPLLMAAGSRLPAHKEWLREALAEYIEEEIGHQEWILNDISACGGDAEAVRHGLPIAATEVMIAYAYDAIQRGNPASLFGMVLVLEGTSIKLALQAADLLQSSLDLPNEAFTYLRSHGELDISHMAFFEKLMNRLEDPEDQKAVIHCANMIYRLYGDIFRAMPLD